MRARGAVWAIFASSLALGVPSALGTPNAFTDPAGDSGAAPDVTSVTADDTASTLVFTVTIANRATFADNDLVAILVDSDRRPTTGADGADYAAGFTGAGANLAKWNGSAFVPVAHGSYTATYAGGVVTFRILKTDLGISTAFDFSVVANKGTDQLRPEDDAPDTGTWTYATQVQPPAPTLRRVSVVFVPATPRAGRIFAVARAVGHLSDGSSVSISSIRCSARLAGVLVKPVARCKWRLSLGARAKRLTIGVGGTYRAKGWSVSPYSFRVR